MTITCPNCKTDFPLNERALAGQIEGEVAKRVASARKSLAAEAERNARTVAAAAVEEKDRALEALRASVGEYREKLAAAHAGRIERERELKEELEQQYGLQIQDRELKLDQARARVEELQRQIAQGSQQIQGESQEISIEQELRAAFPGDTFVPVATGERGGDLVQIVVAQGGQICGKILWESKRTKNWNAAWLEKLRADQRDGGADVSVLVSQAVPPDVTSFKNVDDVWVTRRPLIVPIASMLRAALIRCAVLRTMLQGHQTKADLVYDYLTSSSFAHRMMPIIESLAHLRRDLDAKRTRAEREFAKEEQRIGLAQVSVDRLIGDLQGIAGITVEELDERPLPALVAAS